MTIKKVCSIFKLSLFFDFYSFCKKLPLNFLFIPAHFTNILNFLWLIQQNSIWFLFKNILHHEKNLYFSIVSYVKSLSKFYIALFVKLIQSRKCLTNSIFVYVSSDEILILVKSSCRRPRDHKIVCKQNRITCHYVLPKFFWLKLF